MADCLFCGIVSGEIPAKQVAETGYRIVVNTGPQAGRTVFPGQAHVLGSRPLGWPPG